MKVGLIYVPCGLGDILFSQKIAHHIKSLGYEVYWPVLPQFNWLNDYIKDFTFVSNPQGKYIPYQGLIMPDSTIFPGKEFYSINTETIISEDLFFFQGFRSYDPIMSGKYDSIGLDWGDWRDYIKFSRNKEKENSLYYDVLGLRDGDEYVFVNKNFCTVPNPEVYKNISVDENYYGCKVVEMNVIPGYSLFDWCKVLENCREINMIETSLNYLLESPELFDTIRTKKLTLHHRCTGKFGHENLWKDVEYLHKLPWDYVPWNSAYVN
jgi:3-hydroxymyristoyl/3-hydroxydecanoyl-(acyl carrier protein) dehydratase